MGSHVDYFRADRAWFYVVFLTLGYLGSRGLAKSGGGDHFRMLRSACPANWPRTPSPTSARNSMR
jgi:hypothetical protein